MPHGCQIPTRFGLSSLGSDPFTDTAGPVAPQASRGYRRLSVLWACGHPYLDRPSTAGLGVLLLLAVIGGLLANVMAGRSPEVA